MATSAGQIVFDITADDSSFKSTLSGVESTVKSSMSSAASAMSSETEKMVNSAKSASGEIDSSFKGSGSTLSSEIKSGAESAGSSFSTLAEKAKTASGKISESSEKSKSSLDGMGIKSVAIGSMIANALQSAASAVINFGKESIEAYKEAESNLTIFEQEATNAGWSKTLQEEVVRANGLVSQSTNEAIAKTAVNLGVQSTAAKDLVNSVDMAGTSLYGLNVSTQNTSRLSMMFSRSIESGTITQLSRYVGVLSTAQQAQYKADDETQRAAMLQELLAAKTAGVNAAFLATPAGQIKVFSNSLEQLKVDTGALLEGGGDVNEWMEQLTTTLDAGVNIISTMAPKIITAVSGAVQAIAPQIPSIIEKILPSLVDGTVKLVEALIKVLPNIMGALVSAIPQIIGDLIKDGDAGPLLLAGAALLTKAFGPMLIKKLVADGLFQGLATSLSSKISGALSSAKTASSGAESVSTSGASVIEKTASSDTASVASSAESAASDSEAVAGDVSKVSSAMKTIQSGMVTLILAAAVIAAFAGAIWLVDKAVPSNFSELIPKLVLVGSVIVAMGVIGTAASTLGDLDVAGIGVLTLAAAPLLAFAIAIWAVNTAIPSNFGELVAKLAIVGLVIVAMGVLEVAIASTGIGIAALATGAAGLALAAAPLITFALAIWLVNTAVPSNMSSLIPKFAVLGTVVVAMVALSGVFALIAPAAVIAVIGSAAAAGLVALITTMIGNLNKISSTSIDQAGIKTGIKSIATSMTTIMDTLQSQGFTGFGKVVQSFEQLGIVASVTLMTGMFVTIQQHINALNQIDKGNKDSSIASIKFIESEIKSISDSIGGNNIFSTFINMYKNFAGLGLTAEITAMTALFRTIQDNINQLNSLSKGDKNASIASIQFIESEIKSISDNIGGGGLLGIATAAIADFKNLFSMGLAAEIMAMTKEFQGIQSNIDKLNQLDSGNKNASKASITFIESEISDISSKIGGGNVFTAFAAEANAFVQADYLKKVTAVVKALTDIASGIAKIGSTKLPSSKETTSQIDDLAKVVNEVSDKFSTKGVLMTALNMLGANATTIDSSQVKAAASVISSLANMTGNLNKIATTKLPDKTSITNILDAYAADISIIKDKFSTVKGGIGQWLGGSSVIDTATISAAEKALNSMNQMGSAFSKLQGPPAGTQAKIISILGELKTISNNLSEQSGGIANSIGNFISGTSKIKDISGMVSTINNLTKVSQALGKLQGPPAGTAKKITDVAGEIKEIGNDFTGIKVVNSGTINGMDNTVKALATLSTDLSKITAPSGAASKIISSIASAIKSAADSSAGSFTNIGKGIVTDIANGLTSNTSILAADARNLQGTIYNNLNSKINDGGLRGLGYNVDTQVDNGIRSNMSGVAQAARDIQGTVYNNLNDKINDGGIRGMGWNVGSVFEAGMRANFSGIAQAARDMQGTIYNNLAAKINDGGIRGQGWNAGVMLDQGMAAGVNAWIGTVNSAMGNLSNSAISKLKTLLGIHSPSTVTAEMGSYLVQGLANGIKDAQDLAVKAATDLSDAVSGAININPTVATSSVLPSLSTNTTTTGGTMSASKNKNITLYFQNNNITRTSTKKLLSDLSWELQKA